MASFNEHINQASSNLAFLEQTNKKVDAYWDWQVTTAFYVAVHLINAHIVSKSGLSYRSHEQVDRAINPFVLTSVTRLTEDDYLAYSKLQGLARRARYLCNEDYANKETIAYFTRDKHFARSIRYLDTLITFMKKEHGVNLNKIKISCIELKEGSLSSFNIEKWRNIKV